MEQRFESRSRRGGKWAAAGGSGGGRDGRTRERMVGRTVGQGEIVFITPADCFITPADRLLLPLIAYFSRISLIFPGKNTDFRQGEQGCPVHKKAVWTKPRKLHGVAIRPHHHRITGSQDTLPTVFHTRGKIKNSGLATPSKRG